MALNIKNAEVEQLAADLAKLANETKTEAIRKALQDRMARLERENSKLPSRGERLQRFLEEEVWPFLPPGERGRTLTKDEEEDILGIGPDGY